MADVLQFKPRKPDEPVWGCGQCGGQKYYLTESLQLECCQCGTVVRSWAVIDSDEL